MEKVIRKLKKKQAVGKDGLKNKWIWGYREEKE